MKTTILRQLFVLPLLMAVMAMLYACGAAGAGRATVGAAAPANKSFTNIYVLQQGASAVITPAAAPGITKGAAGAPTVKLERVNDSRCRVGAVCVWAGYISYSFTLIKPDGSTSNFVLSDSMPNGKPSVTQDGLTFTLAGVEPQTVPAKNEPVPDYRVSLKVSNTPPSEPTPRPS
jgi:hypothetical protein